MRRMTALAGALLLATTLAYGQVVPNLMNYQGTLVDANGELLATGTYSIGFSIWDADENGNMVWGPFLCNGQGLDGMGPQVQVLGGNFNVILGPLDTQPTPRPLLDAFGGATRYLEIAFIDLGDPSGATLLPAIEPRQQILSAPYALKAKDADSVGGILRVTTAGYVGIGTTTPEQPLEVALAGGDPVIRLRDSDSGTTASKAYVDFYDTAGRLGYVGFGSTTNNHFYMVADRADGQLRLENTGNLMTFATDGHLDWNVDQDRYARFGRAAIGTVGHTDWASFSHVDSRTTGGYALLQNPNGMTLLNAASGQPIYFRINNATQMALASDGKFGIGTTNPAKKLHVAGGAYVSGNLGIGTSSPAAALHVAGGLDYTPNVNGIQLGHTSGHYGIEIAASGKTPYIDFLRNLDGRNYDMRLICPANGRLEIDGGNVGIGISPDSRLTIKQSSNGLGGGLKFIDAYTGDRWYVNIDDGGVNDFDLQFYPNLGPSIAWLDYYSCHWYTNCDKRFKKDIVPLEGVLDKVLRLKPVSYGFVGGGGTKEQSEERRVIGFVADDVEQVMPELVEERYIEASQDSDAKTGEGKVPVSDYYKTISLDDFSVLAIGAVQELHAELEAERQKTAALEARLAQLEQVVNSLTGAQ